MWFVVVVPKNQCYKIASRFSINRGRHIHTPLGVVHIFPRRGQGKCRISWGREDLSFLQDVAHILNTLFAYIWKCMQKVF